MIPTVDFVSSAREDVVPRGNRKSRRDPQDHPSKGSPSVLSVFLGPGLTVPEMIPPYVRLVPDPASAQHLFRVAKARTPEERSFAGLFRRAIPTMDVSASLTSLEPPSLVVQPGLKASEVIFSSGGFVYLGLDQYGSLSSGGGSIERGESEEECAIRECREEGFGDVSGKLTNRTVVREGPPFAVFLVRERPTFTPTTDFSRLVAVPIGAEEPIHVDGFPFRLRSRTRLSLVALGLMAAPKATKWALARSSFRPARPTEALLYQDGLIRLATFGPFGCVPTGQAEPVGCPVRFINGLGYALEPHPKIVSGGCPEDRGVAVSGLGFSDDIPRSFSLKYYLSRVAGGDAPVRSSVWTGDPVWAASTAHKELSSDCVWPCLTHLSNDPSYPGLLSRWCSTSSRTRPFLAYITNDPAVAALGGLLFDADHPLRGPPLQWKIQLCGGAAAMIFVGDEVSAVTWLGLLANQLDPTASGGMLGGLIQFYRVEPGHDVSNFVETNTRCALESLRNHSPEAFGVCSQNGGPPDLPEARAQLARLKGTAELSDLISAVEGSSGSYADAQAFLRANRNLTITTPQNFMSAVRFGGVTFFSFTENPALVFAVDVPALCGADAAQLLGYGGPKSELLGSVVLALFSLPKLSLFVGMDYTYVKCNMLGDATKRVRVWHQSDEEMNFTDGRYDVFCGPIRPEGVTCVTLHTYARFPSASRSGWRPVHLGLV